jgi:uncharacterized protein
MIGARRHNIDLGAHMAICDTNYARMLKILPDYPVNRRRILTLPLGETGLSIVEFEVVECFRYTSTVSIRQHGLGCPVPGMAPPRMLVRLYHDASTAEVTAYQEQYRCDLLPLAYEAGGYYADEKEQLNILLAEWLSLCLANGMQAGQSYTEAGCI